MQLKLGCQKSDSFTVEALREDNTHKCPRCKVSFPVSTKFVKVGTKEYCPSCAEYLLRAIEREGASKVGVAPSLPQQEVFSTEEEKFYSDVRKELDVDEIPSWWKKQINSFLKEDSRRNYPALSYTLYYILYIKEEEIDTQYGLSALVRKYKEAGEYYKRRKEVLERNKNVDISPQTRTVTIQIEEGGFKPKVKLEDL